MTLRNRVVSIVAVTWFLVGVAIAASPQQTAPKAVQTEEYAQGTKYLAVKDYAMALNAFRKGAEKGDSNSQNALGAMYLQGLGVSKDSKSALLWIQKSADQGNEKGQSNLGKMYYKGDGVAQDFKQGMTWFEKAAFQGHADARYSLALVFLEGKAVPVDIVEAYKWMTLSGNDLAMKNRDVLEKKMTREQISEATKRASDWTKESKRK